MNLFKHCTALIYLLLASPDTLARDASSELDERVRTARAQVMQAYAIPGMAIAVTVNGERHYYNFGVASRDSGQAVSRDTLFELGSISKSFNVTWKIKFKRRRIVKEENKRKRMQECQVM